MSVKENPATSCHRPGSKISETMPQFWPTTGGHSTARRPESAGVSGEVWAAAVDPPGDRHETHPAVTAGLGRQVSDEALAARLRRDPEEFTEIFDRHFRAIYRYGAARLGTGAAEDVAAETFAVAFGQRDRFDPGRGKLRPWLFGIATNLAARHRRTEARHYRALARAPDVPDPGSHEDRVVAEVAARRLRPELLAALGTLSPGERDVVLLVALSQLSHEEVAQALGIAVGKASRPPSSSTRRRGRSSGRTSSWTTRARRTGSRFPARPSPGAGPTRSPRRWRTRPP